MKPLKSRFKTMLITTVHKCEALTKLDFPGTPVVKIPCYQCKDRFDPWLKNKDPTCHSLVQFSCSVVSYSLRPHGLQRARPSCSSPTPGVYLNPCPLRRWCLPTISSSVIPFSSHLQSFPASGSFQMSLFFASGGQSTGVSWFMGSQRVRHDWATELNME